MKKCNRCGAGILPGQLVCPQCGKPQGQDPRVRCRYCGTSSRRSLAVCPGCGESLKPDRRRPVLLVGGVVIVLLLAAFLGPWLGRTLAGVGAAKAVATVQSLAADMPVLVEVPTLTATLIPSITPTPSRTPTLTPTPSMTPEPTLTPTATDTASPTPTFTPTPAPSATPQQPRPTSPPTDTPAPTPLPTVAPPSAVEPENGVSFGGADAIIKLGWRSNHSLAVDECFVVDLRWTEGGAPARNEACVQETYWYVDRLLYLRADQETERVYYWSVRLARMQKSPEGSTTFAFFSPPSQERFFYWK